MDVHKEAISVPVAEERRADRADAIGNIFAVGAGMAVVTWDEALALALGVVSATFYSYEYMDLP